MVVITVYTFWENAIMMRISYDQEVDALYIRLVENWQECRTVRLTDEITLNIGAYEQQVGIEILDAQ